MSQTVHINFFGAEIEIDNPENEDDWINALRGECENFAKDNYRSQYESDPYSEISDSKLGEMASGIMKGIQEFRSMEGVGDDWKDVWKNIVRMAALDVFNEDHDNVQDDALHEADFDQLYESLDEAMSEIEGPVADSESIYETLKDITLDYMYENDTSDVMDLLNNNKIIMMFTPGVNAIEESISDHMFYGNSIYSDGPGAEFRSLLRLMRIDGQNFLSQSDYRVNYKDEENMRMWDSVLRGHEKSPMGKVSEFSVKELVEVIENSGEYALPVWVGGLDIDDIMEADFREPVVMTGGLVGATEFINGSGHVIDVGERHVLFDIDTTLNAEVGYTVNQIFGCGEQELSSKIMTLDEYQAKIDKQLEERGISKDQMSFSM